MTKGEFAEVALATDAILAPPTGFEPVLPA